MLLLLLPLVILSLFANAEKCTDKATRGKIQFYFDPAEWTCFAYPVECEQTVKIDYKLYDTEEECTLKNMVSVRLWKTYRLNCFPHSRMASYKRSNGDQFPFIFSSSLCVSSSSSDVCQSDENCLKHGGFAYCCGNTAYKGDGPSSGTFNFTGMGGSSSHLVRKVVTAAPDTAPADCNQDGDRKDIEWYPRAGMACLSRRKQCSSPAFKREAANQTYPTQQECMDNHFPNLKMTYRLTCTPGYAASTADAAIIFSKDQCGHMHHSDVCDRSEYCAYRDGSPYAFCCSRSDKHHITSYAVYGKFYRRRQRRESSRVLI